MKDVPTAHDMLAPKDLKRQDMAVIEATTPSPPRAAAHGGRYALVAMCIGEDITTIFA
ncbi:MAG: hypothetical protein JSS19_13955 [Proteobacteria bacterium]|nr:hypothetical protein [Pseudomonadota bacterium]